MVARLYPAKDDSAPGRYAVLFILELQTSWSGLVVQVWACLERAAKS
jgi:hypothetical protein